MKTVKKVIIIALVAILAVLLVALGVFQGEARTLLSVKENGDTGVYEVNYAADYKLDKLLEEGGAATEEELVQYILKTMLKGLPIEVPYEIPNLACSTFYAETPEKGYIFGRNLDNQTTDLAVIRTNPKDGYSSVSVVNLSFLGYNESYTPDKLLDRINTLATAYFPLDGINEKGLAVGVLQLQAPVTAQDSDKPDVGTTLAIRAMLDKCATVDEAIDFLRSVDMYAAAKGCFHFQIADATGKSVVVSYVNNEMVITEKTGDFIAATNFYLHDVPFEYEKQGLDRYEILEKTLTEKKSLLTAEEGMDLLEAVRITGTDPDEKGRVYSTQWSALYDLTNPSLTLCADMNYAEPYVYTVG
ncbi:MAG: linear amide C-N hydrolase [Ruminococcaceae bacterium]|nr:linear amide C-N hydrolase [Oscillospiraceae bacterium]